MATETNYSTPTTSASPSPPAKEAPKSHILQAKIDKRVPEVIGGKGVKITIKDPYTQSVSEVYDGTTGAAVGALGWGDEEAIAIVNEAAKATTYQFPTVIGNKYAEDLAKFYIDHSAPGAFEAALWTSSGSEANENVMKIVRQYWLEKGKPEKTKFLSRYSSYHGYTIGALSIASSNRSIPFQDILLPQTQCVKVPEFFPYHNQKPDETIDEYADRLLKIYEDTIIKEDPATIGVFTVETLSGTSLGTVPPTPKYLLGIKQLCDKYDILFHLDEVMCGTGRINPNGKLNCWENFLPLDQGPDIQSVGKTLGSGLVTIAGLLVSPKVRSGFVNGTNTIVGGQTYSCHGFSCYVALKVQQKIMKEQLTKNVFEVGNYLGDQLGKSLADSKIVGDVRGLGGFWSVEFVKDKATKETFDPKLDVCHLIQNSAFAKGLLAMGASGCCRETATGDFVVFGPSFVITKDDVNNMVKIFTAAVKEVEQTLTKDGVIG